MSLHVILRMKSFLFEKEKMWKVRINADGPTWHVRRLTQQEAVAQAADAAEKAAQQVAKTAEAAHDDAARQAGERRSFRETGERHTAFTGILM